MSEFAEIYLAQVRLLLAALPHVAKQPDFALKGGTAINFFYRDAPRLSVDLDLHYLPNCERDAALQSIAEKMYVIKKAIIVALPGAQVSINAVTSNALIRHRNVQIKLEPNNVIRGQLLAPEERPLCPTMANRFSTIASISCVSRAELFAGKLCAALQRQHPRDLFDIQLLLQEDGGLKREIVDAFIVHLASQGKPIKEMLAPNIRPAAALYRRQFAGMAKQDLPLDTLLELQAQLPTLVWSSLTDTDKRFLLGFKRGQPDWPLIRHAHAQELPAIRWKLFNLRKLQYYNPKKYAAAIAGLEQVLANGPPLYENS